MVGCLFIESSVSGVWLLVIIFSIIILVCIVLGDNSCISGRFVIVLVNGCIVVLVFVLLVMVVGVIVDRVMF